MPRYECKICHCILQSPSVPEKCPTCGFGGGGNWDILKLSPLHLDALGKFIVIFEDKRTLGRSDFHIFGKENYKYIDKHQFTISQGEAGWEIEGSAGTVNPTLVNGKEIGEENVPLKDGDEIQIGPLKLKVRE